MHQRSARVRLSPVRGWLATLLCALPFLSGFAIPVLVLGSYALKRLNGLADPKLLKALLHSLEVSLPVAVITLFGGFL
ncbi:hypothetical protein NL385_26455, partial [Klebsiella pneumoniae]|nr:hypothetical protein [Klebsiella pneumoniae]